MPRITKESQLHTRRRKPKQRNRTRITQKVREEVLERSGGRCEWCGRSQAYAFEMAHLTNAGQQGTGREPWNIALLCGPKVNTGTCHQIADETRRGRKWKMEKQEELKSYYGE